MQKISVGLFALAASLTLSVATVQAEDYGKGGAAGAGGAQSHQGGGGGAGGGGGGAKMRDQGGGGGGGGEMMRHDGGGGGGGDRMRHDGGGGGGAERMRNHDGDGGRDHHRRGHWRGGIWIYDDYDGGYGGGYCYRWRHICADRWGWGGPGFRRCLWRHGC